MLTDSSCDFSQINQGLILSTLATVITSLLSEQSQIYQKVGKYAEPFTNIRRLNHSKPDPSQYEMFLTDFPLITKNALSYRSMMAVEKTIIYFFTG